MNTKEEFRKKMLKLAEQCLVHRTYFMQCYANMTYGTLGGSIFCSGCGMISPLPISLIPTLCALVMLWGGLLTFKDLKDCSHRWLQNRQKILDDMNKTLQELSD